VISSIALSPHGRPAALVVNYSQFRLNNAAKTSARRFRSPAVLSSTGHLSSHERRLRVEPHLVLPGPSGYRWSGVSSGGL